MKEEQFFMNPGPTPIPPRVMAASLRPLFSHRSPQFFSLLQDTTQKLQEVFQTKDPVVILTASGTGAMEAALCNLFSPKDKILGVSQGTFGDRFLSIASLHGLELKALRYKEGEAANPEEIYHILQRASSPFQGLLLTHHETTTGVLNDLEGITRLLKKLTHPPLLIVDAISSLGAVDLKTECWGIDIVITCSQKALMTPPGLAMLSLSKRARASLERKASPSFYFDLKKALEAAKKGQTPYTPAISLLLALNEALTMIQEEGLKNVFLRHMRLKEALRAGIKSIGLVPFVTDAIASPAVTTIYSPAGVDINQLRGIMKEEYGVAVSGGKKDLQDTIFRIGHLGYFSEMDIIATLSALEMALLQLGVEIETGAGVGAAEKRLVRR